MSSWLLTVLLAGSGIAVLVGYTVPGILLAAAVLALAWRSWRRRQRRDEQRFWRRLRASVRAAQDAPETIEPLTTFKRELP